jgi:beta-lactamase superfamily II metal-dependent hydrolase
MSGGRRPRNGAGGARRANGRSIEMRMYNVGFGDCFLLRIPTADGTRRVLVDCGYHSQGQGEFTDKELVKQIKADLRGAPLDVVVASHRHQDHISGFGETDLWADVAVEEVWLPFTADDTDTSDGATPHALRALMDAAHGLLDASGKLTPQALAALDARSAEEKAAVEFMLWNARSNAPGIENLLHGFKRADGRLANRRFLPESLTEFPSKFVTPALPGVTIHVLGPPRDPKARRKREVPPSWGVREAALGDATDEIGSPFPAEWRIPAANLPKVRPFTDPVLRTMKLFNDDLLRAATSVDGFLNGESLVLVLEVGTARLLLPGDAEVGAWETILANRDALALAASVTFVKVGHHGSHNATPLMFVRDHLARRTPAVISTQEGDGQYRHGIPLDDLLDAMKAREMPFARTDKAPARRTGIFTPGPGGKWIDCSIPC